MKRLLIVSCSAKKRQHACAAPAFDVYDGAHFQMLRVLAVTDSWPSDLEVRILSARYGLIYLHTDISDYDQKMDDFRSYSMDERVRHELKNQLGTRQYRECFLFMGKQYLEVLQPLETWRPEGFPLMRAEGGIGRQLSMLKKWLLKEEQ